MFRGKLWVCIAAGLLLSAAWMLVGCGGSSSGTGTRLQVSLVDAPLNADAVFVDITSVQVHSEEGGWQTLREYSPALHVNLLDYRTGGQSLMLADTPLTPGTYTMVRLMISGAQVVVDGVSHDVDISNVAQTGVKCNRAFTVEPNQLMALILDFNAGRSFVDTGSGRYLLHPVMTMSPVNVAASVTGTVAFTTDGTNPPATAPTDVIASLYQPGHVGEADFLVAGTTVAADGTLKFDVVPQGTYDLQIQYTPAGSTTAQSYVQTGVVVTAPTTDLGTISITIPAGP